MDYRKTMTAVLVASSLVLAGSAGAADSEKKNEVKKPNRPVKIVPLGQMIKMTFGVKQSPEVPGMSVYCATDSYAAQFNFDGKEGYINIDVSGNLKILEDGKTLLVTYQALVDFEGGDGNAHASSSGSVLVRIGSEAKLLQIGGKDLVVNTKAVKPF